MRLSAFGVSEIARCERRAEIEVVHKLVKPGYNLLAGKTVGIFNYFKRSYLHIVKRTEPYGHRYRKRHYKQKRDRGKKNRPGF